MIRWIGGCDSTTGYGKLNSEITKNLKQSGIAVLQEEGLLSASTRKPSSLFNIYSKLKTEHLDLNQSPSSKNIIFTMNESKDIPDYDINRCGMFDEIWVPSNFCKEAYRKHFSNVHVIPLGVNQCIYNDNDLNRNKDKFCFLSVFSWSFRKGFDVLINSYFRKFSKNDNVVLTIVSKVLGKHNNEGTNRIIDDILKIKSKYYCNDTPEINLITHSLDEKELSRLYKSHHCFVLPTRGEGFCFPLIEAANCCLPIITTNYSGHLDFLNKRQSKLIDIDGFSRVGDDKFFMSEYYNTLEFPTLGEEYIDKFGSAMRESYTSYDKYLKNANSLYVDIKNSFNWGKTTSFIKSRLKIS